MAIDKKLIDQLLIDYKKPEDIIGENGLLKELTKAILERALQAEMTDHLGYEKHDPAGHHRGNSRNGKSQKTLKGEFGELGVGNSARSQGHVRSQDRGQGADALDRLRRQDHLDVRARHGSRPAPRKSPCSGCDLHPAPSPSAHPDTRSDTVLPAADSATASLPRPLRR